MMENLDKRIGVHGGNEPELCAATGQQVRGRHSSHYSVGTGYYISILEKAAMKMSADAIQELRVKMGELLPAKPKRKLSKPINSEEG